MRYTIIIKKRKAAWPDQFIDNIGKLLQYILLDFAEDEDARHLLFDCPALEYLRTNHQTLEDHDLTSYKKDTPEWYRSLIDLSVKLGTILLREEDQAGEE